MGGLGSIHLVLAIIAIANGALGLFLFFVRFASDRRFRPGRMTFKFNFIGTEIRTFSRGSSVIILICVLTIDTLAVTFELADRRHTTIETDQRIAKVQTSSIPITTIAKLMRDKYLGVYSLEAVPMKAKSFRSVEMLANLLADDGNGHVLYFRGEVQRAEEQCARARQTFITYIEIANRRESEMGASTDRDYCYTLPHGYCRQRAGWVEYLLALGFYAQAIHSTDEDARISRINEASAHLRESYRWYPSRFNNLIASKQLERSFTLLTNAAARHRRATGAAPWKLQC